MKIAPPLPAFMASAISSIRWPLDPSSASTMQFASLDQMKEVRAKQKSPSILIDSSNPLVSNLPSTLEELFPATSTDPDRRHFGLISTAFILLGNGLADEAHDLITPMSWPDDLHFNYGPSIYSSVSPVVRSYATYLHCLVHRREAFNVGEFGMVGWQNANYWSNAFKMSPGVKELPHKDLFEQTRKLVDKYKTNARVQEWAQDHDILNGDNSFFESRAVHQLCATVMSEAQGSKKDAQLQEFAERVSETEVRVLLAHSLLRAGYECRLEDILEQREEAKQEL